jgi:hypothetical protein
MKDVNYKKCFIITKKIYYDNKFVEIFIKINKRFWKCKN